MKKLLYLLLLTLFTTTTNTYAQQDNVRQLFEPLLHKKELATYFSGMFSTLNITLLESNEKLILWHKGDHFEIEEGQLEKADYTLLLRKENLQNLAKYSKNNTVEENESFNILKVVFSPFTQASLNNPFMKNPKLLKIAGVNFITQVTLLDPLKKDDYHQTLLFVNNQWIVAPGLQGQTNTHIYLTPAQAIEYQKQCYLAHKENSLASWTKFAKWYQNWKKTVTLNP